MLNPYMMLPTLLTFRILYGRFFSFHGHDGSPSLTQKAQNRLVNNLEMLICNKFKRLQFVVLRDVEINFK